MKSKLKVSVIVPIYNVDKYLPKCIESIQNQTYDNLEIILVDDGSLDNSGNICDNYAKKDNRIVVIHKKNCGVSAARNTGIDIASGEYICFVDGDDYVMEDYVEYLLKLIQINNANISLTTQMFGNYQMKQIKDDSIKVCSGEEATELILCYRIPIGVYCKMFKRTFLSDKIRFFTDLYIGEGFNFNSYAFQRADHVVIGNRRIYYYRRDNPTSATTKFSIEKWENGLLAIQYLKNNFIIDSKKIYNAWEFAYWRTYSDVYDIMVLASAQKKYPKMYNKCLNVIRKKALCCFKVPTSFKERIRALIMLICPKAIPLLLRLRKIKYHVDVNN